MALKTSVAAHPRHDEIEKQLLVKREDIMKQSKEDLKNCIGNQDKTQVGDEMDLAATISREHFQASISKNHRNTLQDIDHALMRMHEGSYGICVDCEEEISPRRLNAFPLAKRCRECQEEHERGLKRGSDARFGTFISD